MTNSGEDPKSGHLHRSWFITGVCGSVGSQILKNVLEFEPKRVICYDNNESALFLLYDHYRKDSRITFFTGDICNRRDVESRIKGCDYVLHAAALKHVYLSELSPGAAVDVNVLGTQHILEAAIANGVERLLFTSSDKAVNPTNVMGASKLLAERLVCAANAQAQSSSQIFASTRFGNVLGSRGSVIPIFRNQIREGAPITLTDPDMTRFIMTLEQAVRLVTDSLFLARGGEIFVTKMPVARIGDLAEIMIEELAPKYGRKPKDIEIEIIGARAGEKKFEELMTEEESNRAVALPRYYVVPPAILSNFRQIEYSYADMDSEAPKGRPYNSAVVGAMPKEELRRYLLSNPALLQGD
jgi:FlaA1/EpsC-like NDP-sugar epimerase